MAVQVLLFRRDRPLQLSATLGSFFHYCQDPEIAHITVFYCAQYTADYDIIKSEYPQVTWVPDDDFYCSCYDVIGAATFVLFLTDDTLFIDHFSLSECCAFLTDTSILGVALSLGLNTYYSYHSYSAMELPPFEFLEDKIKYKWTEGVCDFLRPFDLPAILYRGEVVRATLSDYHYRDPVSLKHILHNRAEIWPSSAPYMIAYDANRAISVPVNTVQPTNKNRRATSTAVARQTLEYLTSKFRAGQRIDYESLQGLPNDSAYYEIVYPFKQNTTIL